MTFPSFADGMPDERTSMVMKAAAGKGCLPIALRVSSALCSAAVSLHGRTLVVVRDAETDDELKATAETETKIMWWCDQWVSTSLEAGASAAWIDFPISVGLDESGIAAPLTMDDAGMVEKAGVGRSIVHVSLVYSLNQL